VVGASIPIGIVVATIVVRVVVGISSGLRTSVIAISLGVCTTTGDSVWGEGIGIP